jgi:hypothetical protein
MAGRSRMSRNSGSATLEFALAYAGLMLPATFALIFTAQLLWVWHSVNEYTRQGASYASTHCWQSSAGNVLDFMHRNIPAMIDQGQFINGPVTISVNYFARDPASGAFSAFTCDGDCSSGCIPDAVTVSVTGYEYRTFVTSLGLPAVTIPDFQTSLPMEGAGCDPEQNICIP